MDSETLLLNATDVLEWNTNKIYLADVAGAGLPIVPTVFVQDCSGGDEVFDAEQYDYWSPIVMKPMISADSVGLKCVRTSAEVPKLLPEFASRGGALVQPFLESIQTRGELSLMFAGKQYLHAVRKWPADDDFRVQENYGGRHEPVTATEAEIALGQKVVDFALARFAQPDGKPHVLYTRVDLLSLDRPEDLAVAEIEMVEPSLFFDAKPESAGIMADAVVAAIKANSTA